MKYLSLCTVALLPLSLLVAACTSNGTNKPQKGDDQVVGGDSLTGDVSGDTFAGDVAGDSGSPGDTFGDSMTGDSMTGDSMTGDSVTGDHDINPGDDVPPQGPNLLNNGSFEIWNGGLPDYWVGNESNIQSDYITEINSGAYEGMRACKLENTSDTHKRFTTLPFSAVAGRYTCTYWVRGRGEIRNAYYDGDYSTYRPASYHAIDSSTWQPIRYQFTLVDDVAAIFEIVFSLRNTDAALDHLHIDDVRCSRAIEGCDTLVCEDWEECDTNTSQCQAADGRCNDAGDCYSWETCDLPTHTCELAPGRCLYTADCDVNGTTPVCNQDTFTCVAGDPCEGVVCDSWKECNPDTALCVLKTDHCNTTADCVLTNPACDTTTHQCEAATHASNILIGGGFETWSVWDVPYYGDASLPDGWYGLDTPYDSEISPGSIFQYSSNAHSGDFACQIIDTDQGERFTTESFNIPAGTYTCAYWVRGHGSVRHRYYSSAGESIYFDWTIVDSDEWIRTTFPINGSVSGFRLALYASFTNADRDHIQFDDVVCTKN